MYMVLNYLIKLKHSHSFQMPMPQFDESQNLIKTKEKFN